jgi:hypothetical protein
MNRALVIHRRNMSKKLKSLLKPNNAKEYWMLQKQRTNREQPNIPLDKLFDFFKTLNSVPTPEECTISPSLYTEDVNMSI